MREKEARSVQKLLHTLYITEPDTVLRRDGEALVAVHANGREDHIPLHLLDRIVCFSGASISPAVIDACVKHDVGFSALSQSGRFCFRLNGPTTGNVLLRKNNIPFHAKIGFIWQRECFTGNWRDKRLFWVGSAAITHRSCSEQRRRR